jgi:hypothetical protein
VTDVSILSLNIIVFFYYYTVNLYIFLVFFVKIDYHRLNLKGVYNIIQKMDFIKHV